MHSAIEVVNPKNLPQSTTQKHYFSSSGTHFCSGQSKSQGFVKPGGLGELKKIH
jgi:hypothetical protein